MDIAVCKIKRENIRDHPPSHISLYGKISTSIIAPGIKVFWLQDDLCYSTKTML